jgi:hypothetical protein
VASDKDRIYLSAETDSSISGQRPKNNYFGDLIYGAEGEPPFIDDPAWAGPNGPARRHHEFDLRDLSVADVSVPGLARAWPVRIAG